MPKGNESYYLHIDDNVKGESKRDEHEDWIVLESFQWTLHASAAGEQDTLQWQDFQFTMRANKASPLIMQHACSMNRKEWKDKDWTVVALRKDGDATKEYVKWILTSPTISSFTQMAQPGDVPLETFTVNFRQVEYSYLPEGEDSTVDGTWDKDTNTTKDE